MDYSISIYPARRLALFRFVGRMTAEDGKRVFLDYVGREGFDPGFVMLTDARRVSEVEARFFDVLAKVHALAPHLRQFAGGATSIVLVEADVPFGMARMLEQVLSLSSAISMHVTESEAEALALAGCGDVLRIDDLGPG